MTMPADETTALRRMVTDLAKTVTRQQAQIDLVTRRCEKLEHENVCLREALHEEREAHQATKRELAKTRREYKALQLRYNDLQQRYDDLVGACNRLDVRYRRLLEKEFGSPSERLCAIDGMIPAALDALIEEGCLSPLHGDADLSSADGSDCDASGAASGDCDRDRVDDVAWRDAPHAADHDDDGPFAFLDCTDDDESGLAWDAMTTTPNGTRPEAVAPDGTVVHLRPANAGGRNPLPDDLERRHETYEPPADHPDLANVVSHRVTGYRDIEKLDLPETAPFVIVYRCPVCEIELPNGMVMQQTIVPPSVIARGQVTDRFLVQSAVDKIADHLPSYRQEQRLARVGAIVPRSKLCRWHIALATFLAVIAEAIRAEILTHTVIGVDDSVHRQPLPGTGTCKQKRIWAVTAPERVYYQVTTTREAQWITRILEPYSGAVMGDGCSSHNPTLARADIIALFCWAHARRYFVEAEDVDRRARMLALIAKLYAVEDRCVGLAPAERVTVRRAHAQPILRAIKKLLDTWQADPAVRPTSGIGKAVTYTLNHWDGLVRYCDIGAAPIDNNHTEQCMRPPAMHRKNSLFSVSDAGADAYATLLTVIQTAKLAGLDPCAYLRDVIDDLHHARREPGELTPAAYAARRAAERHPELAAAS